MSSDDTRVFVASSVDAKEEEEEEHFLPLWIREKAYSEVPEEADEQLWKDILEEDERTGGCFLEQKFLKHIFIDAETRKAYVNMPSIYHDAVVETLWGVVSSESDLLTPVLVKTHGSIKLTTGGKKEPDVLIYGQDRLQYTTRKGKPLLGRKRIGVYNLNPSAIIEVSWTNKIQDELEKFALQMNNWDSERGAINVGYLIDFIPLTNNELPTEENPDCPLIGIDVYRMKPGDDKPSPGDTFLRWRHGEVFPADLKITGEELGQGAQGEGVYIPLEDIIEELVESGVIFAGTIWEAEQKAFLPLWIRTKKYSECYEEADKQLWKDIREEGERTEGSFLDQKFLKYMFICTETRKAYVNWPPNFHQHLRGALEQFVRSQSTATNPVCATTVGGIDLIAGSRKYPDVFIFGQDRTEYDEYKGHRWLEPRIHQFNDGRGADVMNPNGIIEVAWTNKIQDELKKFALQMNNWDSELGTINVGYLIDFIPLRKNKLPTKDNCQNRPLVGIDIYRMVPGDEEPAPGATFVTWRCGEEYPADLKLAGEELGQGTQGEGVSIPFRRIVDAITRHNIIFAATIWEAEQKAFLPLWIRRKQYSKVPEEADKELWKDILEEDERTEGNFLDQKFLKYIFIDAETRKAYVKMPTIFHETVVFNVTASIDDKSDPNPVLATGTGAIDLTTGSWKNPDVFIFGPDRTEYRRRLLIPRICQFDDGRDNEIMNPHAIIEISWAGKIEDELEKFALQMNQCESDELGAIKVGYLIDFIPKQQMPTKHDRKNHPLVGIDVYRMVPGDEEPAPGATFLRWRCGEEYPADLKLMGEELGQGTEGKGKSISLKLIVGALTDLSIVFQKPDET